MQSRVNMPANDGSVRPYLYSAVGCSMVATKSVPSQPVTSRIASPPMTRTQSHMPLAIAITPSFTAEAPEAGPFSMVSAIAGRMFSGVDHRAGSARDAVDHARAHRGHEHLVYHVSAACLRARVVHAKQRSFTEHIEKRAVCLPKFGVADTNDSYLSHCLLPFSLHAAQAHFMRAAREPA